METPKTPPGTRGAGFPKGLARIGDKATAALDTLRVYGISAMARALWRKVRHAAPKSAGLRSCTSGDVFALVPAYRYATCDDLVELKAKYPDYCLPDIPDRQSPLVRGWGLKQMGTLFCAEKIHQAAPARILEVGAGDGTFFDTHFGQTVEYWMIDEGDSTTARGFERALRDRRQTRFVRGLLGARLPELPDSYFGLVFSVSVVEHVPWDRKDAFYSDAYRILEPGGWMIHSIDMGGEGARREFVHIKRAGFILPRRPDLRLSVEDDELPATLFEPLPLVYLNYFGIDREDMWTARKSVTRHHPTVLMAARKPAASRVLWPGADLSVLQ